MEATMEGAGTQSKRHVMQKIQNPVLSHPEGAGELQPCLPLPQECE